MDQRRHPREKIFAPQQVIQLTPEKELVDQIVLSKDISKSGFSFAAPRNYEVGSLFLLKLHEAGKTVSEFPSVMKYGSYYLAQVVWNHCEESVEGAPLYEVGCSFLGIDEGDLDLFTDLINQQTLKELN